MSSVTPYTDLITSEHANQPKFLAAVTTSVQPLADILGLLSGLSDKFDLDLAVGVQLDAVGEWVGRSRYLSTPLVDVYFSLDTMGLGLDEGTWKGRFDPDTGLTALPDDTYRTLLRAKILANLWDGTIPGAYAAWNVVFGGTGYQVLIQDNGDMSMAVGLVGRMPDAVTMALFTGGYLDLKPSGVSITFYAVPTLADVPFFGFDAQNAGISGFDFGGFAEMITTS